MEESELAADPIEQFEAWFREAAEAGVPQPEAMALATAGEDGPSVRFVLLKKVDAEGFVFFTNYESRKGREIESSGHAALALHWQPLGRQVRALGRVSRTSRQESLDYFASRPRGSQVAAAISPQSRPVGSRLELEAAWGRLEADLDGAPVPLPDHWGGYRLRPDEVEFWEHRDNRLHDRVLYTRGRPGWTRTRLAP